jgi:D-serine deaminase-like pyridoxal phosphate-dependent protein
VGQGAAVRFSGTAKGGTCRIITTGNGYIDITRAGREFAVGEQLHIIPAHVCVAVNLHETVYGKRGNQVEEVWKVEGRGKLQ